MTDGLCECGCGQRTSIAKRTSRRDGTVKGQPLRFISGHHQAVVKRTRKHPLERFWAKVDRRGPDECWPWKARRTRDGYGQFRLGATGSPNMHAHRALWLLTRGAISAGKVVCHSCDNRACCNPRHLWLGTPADNSRDMADKGRAARLAGEASPHTKLTEVDIRAIRARAAEGYTQAMIGATFGLSGSAVGRIVRRETWGHVA